MSRQRGRRVWERPKIAKLFKTTVSFVYEVARNGLDRTMTGDDTFDIERMRPFFSNAPELQNPGHPAKLITKTCQRCDCKFETFGMRSHHCQTCAPTDADHNLLSRFGMNLADLAKMVARQNNCCAICDVSFDSLTRPKDNRRITNIDHDHVTNVIRGILCLHCNYLMVALDKPGWLERALAYKKSFEQDNTPA